MRGGMQTTERATERAPRRMRAFVRRLRASRDGVSLIEFAIAAPVLVILLLSMMDVVPLAVAKAKLNQATQTSGDIAAATSQMQTSDVANVFAAAAQVMAPLPTSTLILRVSNVYSDGNGNAKIYWSCGQGSLAPLTPNSKITTTANGTAVSTLIYLNNTGPTHNGTNTSFIMTESSYVADPHTGFIMRTPSTLVGAAYLLPRQSSYVGFPWDGTYANQPTVPTLTTTNKSVGVGSNITCLYAT